MTAAEESYRFVRPPEGTGAKRVSTGACGFTTCAESFGGGGRACGGGIVAEIPAPEGWVHGRVPKPAVKPRCSNIQA